jgi:hypothetical protein
MFVPRFTSRHVAIRMRYIASSFRAILCDELGSVHRLI